MKRPCRTDRQGRRHPLRRQEQQPADQQNYGNFEMYVDWKIDQRRLAASTARQPAVQIWDVNARTTPKKVGSGGLYNKPENLAIRFFVADNKVAPGHLLHQMVGDKGYRRAQRQIVVDNTPLENYWDRKSPLPAAARSSCSITATICGSRTSTSRNCRIRSPYSV